MNGGAGSKIPVRPPITRPVSFQSLPEHQRNSPAYLSPHPYRKSRTPRSSPLTGPSLSSDQLSSLTKDDQGNQKPRYRPNRISSTPDIAVPIQSFYDSDTPSLSPPSSSTPSTISLGTIGAGVPVPPIPKSPRSSSSCEDDKEKGKNEAEGRNRLSSITKRLSIISVSSSTTNEKDKDDQKAARRRSGFLLHSSSTSSLASTSSSRTVRTDGTNHTAPPMPTIPQWALNAMREEAAITDRNVRYGHRRGTSDDSSLPLPNQSIQPGRRPSTAGSLDQPRPPSVSRDPRENWMSMTDTVPRFSRLGRDAVVMPITKKESLAKMKSASSMRSMRSTATLSQPPGPGGDSGATTKTETTKTESSPVIDSNATDTKPNLKEKEGRLRRISLPASLKSKIPKIIVPSSAGTENVPPLPPSTSNDSTLKIVRTSPSPPPTATSPTFSRRSVTARRDSDLAAIDEIQPSSSSPSGTQVEFGRKSDDVKSQDTQKTKTRRKSIKQIIMRITTAPVSAGEKVKSKTIHDSPSIPVLLSSDALLPLDPPPGTRFEILASSSASSLASTKELSETSCGHGDMGGRKRFKGIKKRWNAIFTTVKG